MLISTSKIVGKTVVVRVRRCVVGDFFFVLKSLMWGLLALVKACKAWTILLLPTALVSVTDPVTATGYRMGQVTVRQGLLNPLQRV